MLVGDLHVHTVCSDGLDTPESIVSYAKRIGLDFVAITDHDTVSCIQRARVAGKELGVAVVPGVELTTRFGHILALFVEEVPPKDIYSDIDALLEWVEERNGLAIYAHPYGFLGFLPMHRNVVEIASKLHGIEIVNGRTLKRGNEKAMKLAQKLGKVVRTGGSDAHRVVELGLVKTFVDASSPNEDDVATALAKGMVRISEPPPNTTIIKNIVSRIVSKVVLRFSRRSV